jgi:hypothetical protein
VTEHHTKPHSEVEAQFSDRYDGELTQAEAARFDAHLRGCSACEGAYAAFTASLGMFKALPRVEAPKQLRQQVTARLYRQSRGALFNGEHGGVFSALRAPYEVMAVVVLVAVGGLWMTAQLAQVTPLREEDAVTGLRAPTAQARDEAPQEPMRMQVALPPDVDRVRLRRRLREQGWDVRLAPGAEGAMEVELSPERLGALSRSLSAWAGTPPLPPLPTPAPAVIFVHLG